ncbi:HTH-type transcriptional regulator PuuR [Halotalea alkalilenta]|uniref:Transcriptional regulator n=1 Tax=Halotalea alkalilenta TaxID=376489 RepID=A0A172YBP6_9GAMM|nr:HTH-type transcriptional regulator PuuR [Halotalea alkalilenta]ANF56671.1 transcriptional regulator [Halotalea alkalilenta]
MSGAAWLAIGTRLAEIRQRHGLSQRKVAELAGLTHSAVSTVEQNKVSPSVSTLHKLLAVYGLSLADFFAEEERARARPKVVIEPEERLQLGSQGVSLELIHRPDGEGNLGMLIESYEPGSSTGEQLTHPGEEIGTVLEGVLEIVTGGVTYRLEPGQSYVIDTSVPHRFSNPGERTCRLISAHTPLTL